MRSVNWRRFGVLGLAAAFGGLLSLGGCPGTDTSNGNSNSATAGLTFEDLTANSNAAVIVRPPRNGNSNSGGGTSTNSNSGDNTNTNGGSTSVGLPVVADDHILAVGNPPLTIVEYADFQCPNCGRFARNTFSGVKEKYIDTGKVRWVVRHLPLTAIHENAQAAAEAAECASNQGKFFEYGDILYNNQSALTTADLLNYATQLGLDTSAFTTCTTTRASKARVDRDAQSGRDLNIPGTPAFFIGNDLVTGFKRIDEFSALVDAKLAEIAP